MQDDRFFLKHNVGDNIYSIFDDLPGYTFFVKDTKLRYVLFNERLLNVFGVEDGAQILGKRDEDFVSPHIMEEWRKDDLHIIETGKFIHNRVELVPSGDGFVDWSTTNKKPLYCARGVLCGVIGVTRPFSQSNASLQQNSELGASLKLMHQSFRDNIAITELAAAAQTLSSRHPRPGRRPVHLMRLLRVRDERRDVREALAADVAHLPRRRLASLPHAARDGAVADSRGFVP